MKDIISTIDTWLENGREFAIARVIGTWRSSPRPVGSAMIIDSENNMAGSVSGGCVEKSVIVAAKEVMKTKLPMKKTYGVSNDMAWEVGLSCGGKVEVLIEPFNLTGLKTDFVKLWDTFKRNITEDIGQGLITDIGNGGIQLISKNNIPDKTDNDIFNTAITSIEENKSEVITIRENEYFLHSFNQRPLLLIIGAAHVSSSLIFLANRFNFKTIVIDPRNIFAEQTHYEVKPDTIHIKWPQEILPDYSLDSNTYAVTLSHDPKIDDEALDLLLKSDARYIGALGSSKTHQKRLDRLKERGYNEEELRKIKSPVGVSIHAETAQEIALSIMAEIIEAKNKNVLS